MKVVSRHVEWLHWLGKLPICSVVKGDCYTFQRQCNDQIFQKKRLTWLCRSKNIIHTHVITSCFGRTVYEYRLQQSAIMYSVCCSNIIVGIKSPLELFSVVLLQNCITLPSNSTRCICTNEALLDKNGISILPVNQDKVNSHQNLRTNVEVFLSCFETYFPVSHICICGDVCLIG